jgi:signal transduction histidine kinase
VVRHSGAQAARVRVSREGDTIVVQVSDDGRGFVEGTVSQTLGGGLGLIGMQERAAGVGGRVKVESRQGEGTRVTMVLPIGQTAAVLGIFGAS